MSRVNLAFATALVDGLVGSGLRHACISPGSRSGPLAIAFARNQRIRTWVHVDERSGAFFALGMAKRTGEPVAVLTTSGTAAAELHPAVLEAHHSRTPLVLLTADRPPEVQDRGANQTVDQARLFGSATRWTFDPGPPEASTTRAFAAQLAARAMAVARGPVAGPVHLNLPFREPLLSAGAPELTDVRDPEPPIVRPALRVPDDRDVGLLATMLGESHRPFLHAGTLPRDMGVAAALSALTATTGLVVHAEPTSQLRRTGVGGLLRNTEALLRDPAFAAEHAPDLVIRLGAAPTSRTVHEWLARSQPEHVVLVDPDGVWLDPDSIATHVLQSDLLPLLSALAKSVTHEGDQHAWRRSWLEADRAAAAGVEHALQTRELFEASALKIAATNLPRRATVVVGSSMAIRDADWFWPVCDEHRFIANRGASGIDGFVSTALGAAAVNDQEPTIAICGDLTLYHDMNGLLASRAPGVTCTFIVLNNDGGGIFSFLPEAAEHDVFETVFATPTGLDLQRVAALYGCEYRSATDARELEQVLRTLQHDTTVIVDVRFTRAASVSAHRAVWDAASSAIRAARRGTPGT